MTTLTTHTVPTAEVQVGDLVRVDGKEVEVTVPTRPSLFGHGWMIAGREVVNGVPQRGDFLHQTDADTVAVWR